MKSSFMIFAVLVPFIFLAACGGGRGVPGIGASGNVSKACMAADRAAANPVLCACVQLVANAELSSRDRALMATFFADPETAHAVRISDTTADDAFWERYQAYVRSARAQCG